MITSHNHAAYVIEAVRSALAQTKAPREVVVVDDGSTDGSVQLLRELELAEPLVRVVSQPNQGVILARNRALQEATADWVALLDSDDALEPTFIESTWAGLVQQADPRVAFVYTDALLVGATTRIVTSRSFSPFALSLGNYVVNCCLLSRDAALAVDGYDVAFQEAGHEDWDFFLRLSEAGFRGLYVPGALLRYRQHDAGSRNARSVAVEGHVIRQMIARHPKTSGRPLRRRILLGESAALRTLMATRRAVVRAMRARRASP